MSMPVRFSHSAIAIGFLALASGASAIPVTIDVLDAAGQPLADAAVYAEPAAGVALPKQNRLVEIEQKQKRFLPQVTVVQTGTAISFPNNDTVRHHVYSFSPAKVFELKLYSGVPSNPVSFDKPGTVVIGCNIHDQMAAYILVVPTPYFGKTDAAGRIRLDVASPGTYRLKAWHAGLPAGTQAPEQSIHIAAETQAAFRLGVKNAPAQN
jgi:plastocyanin